MLGIGFANYRGSYLVGRVVFNPDCVVRFWRRFGLAPEAIAKRGRHQQAG